ncbi:hypothetical protein [Nonlabens xiamenensis]|uniref:hypothetical protein n=1 Tax=Nonlabens xiamenensis TaxID=2341043 RepID=UPI000F60D632|nr:hypothetical protein [Nonlabens xiamenensis]
MKNIKILFVIGSSFLVCSCTSLLLIGVGANQKRVKPIRLTNNSKQVVFLPMHHVGVKSFYQSVYTLTDSLGKQGYEVFYEGTGKNLKTHQDTIYEKKLRKLFGFALPKNGYLDSVEHKLLGQFKVPEKYMNQPKANLLYSIKSNPKNGDVSIQKLIEEYENKYKEIELDSCDLITPLSEEYSCKSKSEDLKKARKIFNQEFILQYRNKSLAEQIHHSQSDKIIIAFGKRHISGTIEVLRQLDSSWHED